MGKRAWNSGFAGGMGKRSAPEEEFYQDQGEFVIRSRSHRSQHKSLQLKLTPWQNNLKIRVNVRPDFLEAAFVILGVLF